MKNVKMILCGIIFAVLCGSCNNFFHDLIPPDGDRIISFKVEGQLGNAIIGDNFINVELEYGTDPSALIPVIKVSPRATLIPITLEYVQAAFPSADLLELAMGLYTAYDIETYIENMVKQHNDFTVPKLDMPIDFSGPVDFYVIAGQGNMRRYTVTMEVDTNEASITGFTFSKYDNPELVYDALGVINESAKTITIEALYPAEMSMSYKLIPSFEIRGESITIDDGEIISRETTIQFDSVLDVPQTKTLKVIRGDSEKEYTLSIVFKEDPDSIRSITDFRFTKANNPGIAATAAASIRNSDNLGTISVQVFYTSAKPSELVPQFISPGTVSVGGITQISGVSSHDFSQALEYRVVSRNNKYMRTYTVHVEYIDISAASPVITSFRFSCGVNHELAQDTVASISDSSGIILITAQYGGNYAPSMLIPEFHATGIVTVYGAVQISDSSAQNFSAQVKYTVTDPLNSLLTRDYWVKVSFTRDTSGEAKINIFSFHPDENPLLADELFTRIDQNAGTISVYAPVGSGVTAGIMTPRFIAVGHVEVGGIVQTSGISGHLYDAPIVYTVVSANGTNQKSYTVTVRELQSTIYVNPNALGLTIGTDWQNAFRNLEDAIDAAAEFPEDIPKEIWIAAGAYMPDDYFQIVSNTSYIGGFAGHETAKSQRNVAANMVTISGGGSYLFSGTGLSGELLFENLSLTNASDGIQITSSSTDVTINELKMHGISGSAINCDTTGAFTLIDSDFNATGSVTVSDSTALVTVRNVEMKRTSGSSTLSVTTTSDVTIDTVVLDRVGMSISCSGGTAQILNSDIKNYTGRGITLFGWGNAYLSNVTIDTVGHDGVYNEQMGRLTVDGLVLQNIAGQGIVKTYGGINLSCINITNVNGSDAINLNSGTLASTIDTVNIDGVPNGRGITIDSSYTTQISNTTIKNCKTTEYGGGLYLHGSGSKTISENTLIENCEASQGGGIYSRYGILNVSNATIRNCTAGNRDEIIIDCKGGGIYLYNSAEISNTTIEYCWASGYGGGIYSYAASSNTVQISNATIKNCKSSINGGGINDGSFGRMIITGTTIENCEAVIHAGGGNGGGITSNGNLTISNTTIKNCKSGGIYGGGIQLINYSMGATISDTTIEDCSAHIGGGISFYDGGNLNLFNTTIKNVTEGGGLAQLSTGRSGKLVVTGSRFENCRATSYNISVATMTGGGAIYTEGTGHELTNTEFINCTAQNYDLILDAGAFEFIRGCTFTHDNNLVSMGTSTNSSLFGSSGGNFENCTFNNLKGNRTGENYLFSAFSTYPNATTGEGGSTSAGDYYYTFKNCTFYFNAGSAGLLVLGSGPITGGGDHIDHLLMDGVRINNAGGQTPLIWLNDNRPAGTFQFKANNVYNGTTLNTLATITNLVTSGLLRLQKSAMPTVVP